MQRVCANYRIPVFNELSQNKNIDFKLAIGDDIPNTKTRSSGNLNKIKLTRFRSFHFNFFGRNMTYPIGLIRTIKEFEPDIVLCEGESFFIGYLKVFLYQIIYNKKKLGIMHWCYIKLPGRKENKISIKYLIKKYFRNKFDACVLYSSYSKKSYIELGQPREKAFVATNVGNTDLLLNKQKKIMSNKMQLRKKLKIDHKFTVLYVGSLIEQKKPEKIIEIAEQLDSNKYNFLVIGKGQLFEKMKKIIEDKNIKNINLLGHIENDLAKYYLASDVFILPGLGGITISEAFISGLPVIVNKTDGVEYDLVKNFKTGFRLKNDSSIEFKKAIEYFYKNPKQFNQMSKNCKLLIEKKYNTKNMVNQILLASQYTLKKKHNFLY